MVEYVTCNRIEKTECVEFTNIVVNLIPKVSILSGDWDLRIKFDS